jgi:hypothetical protein
MVLEREKTKGYGNQQSFKELRMISLPDRKRIEVATTRISVANEFPDMIALSADCHCGDDFHRQQLVVEINDDETEEITLSIYSKIFVGHWYLWSPYDTFWEKLQKRYTDFRWRLFWAWSLLFRGYAEGHSTFSMIGNKQIDDYIDSISRARNKIWIRKHELFQERAQKLKQAETAEQVGDLTDGC